MHCKRVTEIFDLTKPRGGGKKGGKHQVKHLRNESILISIGLCNHNPEGTGKANSQSFITANMQTGPLKFSTDTDHIKYLPQCINTCFYLENTGSRTRLAVD